MSDHNPYSPPAAALADDLNLAPGTLRYAGFWRRFGAFWLDALVFLPLTGLIIWLSSTMRLFHLYYFVPGIIIGVLFNVYLVKRYGGTPGKLALKIRIAKLDGGAVGYREAWLRSIVQLVLTALISVATIQATLQMTDAEFLSLGFSERNLRISSLTPSWYWPVNIAFNIWIWSEYFVLFTNPCRRALQDFLAGTVVIHKA